MKNLKIILLTISIIFFSSCSESGFLDINKDPDSPTDVKDVSQILPSVQAMSVFAFSNALNRICSGVVQHLVVQRYDSYSVDGEDTSNPWRFSLYAGALQDIEVIIEKATADGNNHYVGVAKLMKAYNYNMMVDIWGDIPYSEANNEAYPYPKFDDDAAIYDAIFSLIDEALLDLDKDNTLSLSNGDLIFNGSINAWKRMGNTLKLKMFNTIRLDDAAKAKSGIEALVTAETSAPGTVLITNNSHNFQFKYGSSTEPDNRHPGFQADYVTKGEAYICNYFENFMSSNFDPRYTYYFYKQNGTFAGRDYGSSAAIGNDADDRTVQGIYSCGGKFEDNSAESVDGNSANGDGYFRMITNSMRLFIECEAALTLGASVSTDARSLFEAAVRATFDDVNDLSADDLTQALINTYVNTRLAAYDAAATNNDKLELVIEDKWVSLFGNGIEAYTDYRRTGFPDIPSTADPSNNVFPNRLPYSNDELSSNSSAPSQPQNSDMVFWDR